MVCDMCGTQTQEVVEEAEYQGEGLRGNRIRTSDKADKTARQKAQAVFSIPQLALTYCSCLQSMLRMQAEVLERCFHVSPRVGPLIRRVWLAYLAKSPALQQLSSAGPLEGEDQGPQGGQGLHARVDAHAHAAPLHHQAGLLAPKRARPFALRLRQSLPPHTTLAVTFLSCHVLREAVGPHDVLRWAAHGQLPFLDLELATRGQRAAAMAGLLEPALAARLPSSPAHLARDAVCVALAAGVALPPVNADALVLRHAAELALDGEVVCVALELLRLLLLGSPLLELNGQEGGGRAGEAHVDAYVLLAAVLVLAIKSLHRLDGVAAPAAHLPAAHLPGGPSSCAAPIVWLEWARGVLRRVPPLLPFPVSDMSQGAPPPARQLRAHLSRLAHGAWSRFSPLADVAHVQRWLKRVADEADDGSGAARADGSINGEAAGSAWPLMPLAPPRSEAATGEIGGDCVMYDVAMPPARASGATGGVALEYWAVVSACAAVACVEPAALHGCVVWLEEVMETHEAALHLAQRYSA